MESGRIKAACSSRLIESCASSRVMTPKAEGALDAFSGVGTTVSVCFWRSALGFDTEGSCISN